MKTYFLAFLMLAVSPLAMASKARVTALQNSPHIVDYSHIFDTPTYMLSLPDQVLLEMGQNSSRMLGATSISGFPLPTGGVSTAGPNSEGGFLRSAGDQKWGVYLGRKSPLTTQARYRFGFLGQENPVEVMWGMSGGLNMAATVSYSNSDKKDTGGKQNAYGMRLGIGGEAWDAALLFGLGSGATGADLSGNGTLDNAIEQNATYKGTTGFKASGSYRMESFYFYGSYSMDGFKLDKYKADPGYTNGTIDGQATAEFVFATMEVGAIDTMKMDQGEFFYGVSLISSDSDNKDLDNAGDAFKSTRLSMPFLMGVEVTATEWMQLRGSIKQPVLIGSRKAQDSDAKTLDNETSVGLGASILLDKWTLDATLAGVSTGRFDFGTNTFANASLNYKF